MNWRLIDIENLGVHGLLSTWAQHRPAEDVLIFEGSDVFKDRVERYTYAEMDRLGNKCANMLASLNVKKGDRVALYLPNCPEFVISYFGVLKAGACVVPVSPILTSREIAYELVDTGASVAITLSKLAENIDADEFPHLGQVLKIDVDNGKESFYELLNAASEKDPGVEIDVHKDIAMIPYTSGSTGVPKGVPHTHYSFMWNLREALLHFGIEQQTGAVCTTTPLFHVTGYHDTFGIALFAGFSCVVMERFDPEKILQLVDKYKVTFTLIPTAGLIWLLMVEDKDKYDLSSLEAIMSGGAAVPVDVGEQITREFGVDLMEGYGSTEVLISHVNPRSQNGKIKFGSVGPRVNDSDNVIVKIVDEVFGKEEKARGEFGEITIKSPSVASGYLNKPEDSAENFQNGFWYSGDIGYVDDDGYLYITDRKKDMISVSGFKCWPREVEELIHQLPHVSDAAVVGKPHPVKGEVPVAFVAIKAGVSIHQDEIHAHLQENLAKYKLPVEYIFVDAIPKTLQGKTQKDALRARLKKTENA